MAPTLGGIRDLPIHRANAAQEHEVGRTLLARREHPRGMTAIASCQVRQEVSVAHGWGHRGLDPCAIELRAGSLDRVGRCRM